MKITRKIAAILALLLGVMSVIAGSKVLLGADTKDYTVLTWLVIYNVVLGFISIYAAYLIWKDSGRIMMLSIFSLHLLVLLYLKFISSIAASESVEAMMFRVSAWGLIIILSTIIPKYINQKKGKK